MSKMVLFVVGKFLNAGGVEKVTLQTARMLSDQGYDVALLPLLNVGKDVSFEKINVLTFRSLLKLILKKRNIKWTIINCWSFPFASTLIIKAIFYFSECRLICYYHNTPEFMFRGDFLRSILLRKLIVINNRCVLRMSDKYLFLTDEASEEFIRLNKLKHSLEKIGTLTNLVEKNNSKLVVIKKKFSFCFCGRLENKQKRLDRLLYTFQAIKERYSSYPLHLTIVGDGPDRIFAENLCRSLGLEDCVSFVGSGEPEFYYRESSFLLLTSDYEGFGIVLVEAMSYGCIPITTRSYSGISSVVPSDCGLVFERSADPSYICDWLSLLFSNESVMDNYREKCINKSKDYDRDSMFKKWFELIEGRV